jgi:hypothetical protein
MDVRIDGRLKFSNVVYEPRFEAGDDRLVITADMQPTLVDPTPGVRFDRNDPREGAETVMVVHDGRGTPETLPPETPELGTRGSRNRKPDLQRAKAIEDAKQAQRRANESVDVKDTP